LVAVIVLIRYRHLIWKRLKKQDKEAPEVVGNGGSKVVEVKDKLKTKSKEREYPSDLDVDPHRMSEYDLP
jgi:hypothetical protein